NARPRRREAEDLDCAREGGLPTRAPRPEEVPLHGRRDAELRLARHQRVCVETARHQRPAVTEAERARRPRRIATRLTTEALRKGVAAGRPAFASAEARFIAVSLAQPRGATARRRRTGR